jgi:hypothetical protein
MPQLSKLNYGVIRYWLLVNRMDDLKIKFDRTFRYPQTYN